MESNIMRRVYIKNGADLPKESGKYITCNRAGEIHLVKFDAERNLNRSIELWITMYDWYLSPVSREEIVKILKNNTKENPIIKGNIEIICDFQFEQIADKIITG